MESKAVVHYFEGWGLGEFVRMILWWVKVPYENKFTPKFGSEEWKVARENFEFKSVPVLEIDGKSLSQSSSTMRYIARKYGMAPEDPFQEYLVDSGCELLRDIFIAAQTQMASPKPEERAEGAKKFCEEALDTKIGFVENRLK